jgi:hypothetical protein
VARANKAVTNKHRKLIQKLGQRPIAFIPAYADLPSCNVNAAVLLSQMVYWSDKGMLEDGWCYKVREEWVTETHLTLRELDTARFNLRKAQILEEHLAGLPAKLHWRINFDKLAALLLANNNASKSSFSESAKPGSKLSQKRKSNVAESAELSTGKRKTSFSKSAEQYKEQRLPSETTPKNTGRESAHPRSVSLPLSEDFKPDAESIAFGWVNCRYDEDTIKRLGRKFVEVMGARDTVRANWQKEFRVFMLRGHKEGWDDDVA